MDCYICGAKDTVRVVKEDEEFSYKGYKIIVPDYVTYRCSHCGESVVSAMSLLAASLLLENFRAKIDMLLEVKNERKD